MAWSKREVYLLGTGSTALGRGVEIAAGLFSVWFATQILATEGYGVFALSLTVVEVLTLLASGGLEALVVYRTSRADAEPGELGAADLAGAALGAGLLVGCAAAAALWLGADALAAAFDKPEVSFWLGALAWLVPIGVARNIYAAWHRARQRIPQSVFWGQAFPRLATALALAAVWAVAPTPGAIAAAFVAAPLCVLIPWFLRHPLNPGALRGGLDAWSTRYALRLSFTALLQRGVTQGDILLLGLLSTSAVTGQYAVASRIAILASSVFALFVPTFAARVGYLLSRQRSAELEDEYDQTRAAALLGALLAGSAIAVTGREVLGWFGDFQAATPVVLILTAAWLGQASFGMNRAYLSVAGHSGWTLAVTSLLLGTNLALDVLLIPRWGGEGAAAASLISIVGTRALTALVIWRLERFRTYGAGLALQAALGVGLLLLAAAGAIAPELAGLGLLPLAALVALRHRQRWTSQLSALWAELRRLRVAR